MLYMYKKSDLWTYKPNVAPFQIQKGLNLAPPPGQQAG